MTERFGRKLSVIPPVMLLGILVILVPIFVFITLDRIRDNKRHISSRLMEKGQALIRSFEAGTRAGMMNRQWGAARLQRLLTEVSFQPDIVYMVITDREGRILFHSDEKRVGGLFEDMPVDVLKAGPDDLFSRIARFREKEGVFEVYKRFTPQRPHGRFTRHGPGAVLDGMMGFRFPGPGQGPPEACQEDCPVAVDGQSGVSGPVPDDHIIFAGLSLKTAQMIQKRFVGRMVAKGMVFFVLGLAGIFSLFVFQGYRDARNRLTRVQAFSDTVVDHMPAGLIVVDDSMAVKSVNRSAQRILGKGLTVLPEEIGQLVTQAMTAQAIVEKEITCRLADGQQLLLDVSVSPVMEEMGRFSGMMVLFKDLTELHRLKKEVETSKRLAAIGKLAAGVAHEIRNPLSSIKGFATYFGQRYADVPQDKKTADIMVQETERLNRSVTQLLEFAKPMELQILPVDLENIVDHSVRLLQHDLERKQISVSVASDLDHQPVFTDPDRMNQVLLNLFLNSIQAMDEHGRLSVHLGWDAESGHCRIDVSDTGKGIAPEDLEKVFDPYFTTRNDGTGLGLAVVHRIVESLGGDIAITSTENRGTLAVIRFPAGGEE